MRLRRSARLHEAGVDSSIHWEFAPGEMVLTSEGLVGRVIEVEDGPHPGNEQYLVELDGGLGGGAYSSGELRRVAAKADAEQVVALASDDYPELEEILVDRPPLPHSERRASRATLPHDSVEVRLNWPSTLPGYDHKGAFLDRILEPIADRMIQNQDPRTRYDPDSGRMASYDWCRFRRDRRCYYPHTYHPEATAQVGYAVWIPVDRGFCPREKWDDQRVCPAPSEPGPNSREPNAMPDATWSWEQGGQRFDPMGRPVPVNPYRMGQINVDQNVEDMTKPDGGGDNLVEELADMLEDHRQRKQNPYSDGNPYMATLGDVVADWNDVRSKAQRMRSSGHVRIISASPQYVTAEVRGDTNVYQTTLEFEPGTKRVAMWSCGCAWSAYSWGRSGRWTKYEGRTCSHALALIYEVQSRGFGGQTVTEDVEAPDWRSDPSITVKVPGDYKRAEPGEWRVASRKPWEPLIVKWRGMIHTVMDSLMGGTVFLLSSGDEVPVSEVTHPNYDPIRGLGSLQMVASPNVGEGVMVAFRPPEAVLESVQVNGGEPLEDLHVTLAFLGDAVDVDHDRLMAAVREWSVNQSTLSGSLGGYGVFENDEKVLWASVDVPDLDRARVSLMDSLARWGIVGPNDHGFTPHLTLLYGADDVPDELPEGAGVEFPITEVWVVHGENWQAVALNGKGISVDALDFANAETSVADNPSITAPASVMDEDPNKWGNLLSADDPRLMTSAATNERWWVYEDNAPYDPDQPVDGYPCASCGDRVSYIMGDDPDASPYEFNYYTVDDAGVRLCEGCSLDAPIDKTANAANENAMWSDWYSLQLRYPKLETWRLEVEKGSARAAGTTYFLENRITLAPWLVEQGDLADVLDTLRHEAAHALAGSTAGHGLVWQRWARMLGADPSATSPMNNVDPGYKWVGQCPIHGQQGGWFRKPSRTYLCGECRNDLTLIHKAGGLLVCGAFDPELTGIGIDALPNQRPHLGELRDEPEPALPTTTAEDDDEGVDTQVVAASRNLGDGVFFLDQSNSDFMSITVNGEPVAQIAWTMEQDRNVFSDDEAVAEIALGDDNGYYFEVESLFINPEHRRKGYATILFDEFRQMAERHLGDKGWSPGKFTSDGAAFWRSISGESVNPTRRVLRDRLFDASRRVASTEGDDTQVVPGDPRLAWIMGGGSTVNDAREIAQAADAHLAKMGLKAFTPAEQAEIINEGEGVHAANLDRLDIAGTHYEALEVYMNDDDEDWLL